MTSPPTTITAVAANVRGVGIDGLTWTERFEGPTRAQALRLAVNAARQMAEGDRLCESDDDAMLDRGMDLQLAAQADQALLSSYGFNPTTGKATR